MRLLCLASVAATLALACSSKSALVGAGGQCQAATDCAEGLVCIPQKDGTSACSSDLSGVQKLPPKPADAAAPVVTTDAAAAGDSPTGPAGDSGSPPPGPDASGGDASGD